ncbi:MAG: phage tail protein [Chloroflexi bacterium RBG_19FT_COMBO_62_14]|nr:MAG: phage tail protein [Chloroflexi bacterium RBG_19FT_COMBO_62_14]
MAIGRADPLVGFHYAVEIQGTLKGYFTECSGLGSEHDVIEHKIVDEKGKEVIQKIPGRLKWEAISLKRGITDNMDIWMWRKKVEDGDVDGARSNGSIVMFDQHLSEMARWNFENAWPVKVSGPSVKSDSNEIGIEELSITHEGLWRVK